MVQLANDMASFYNLDTEEAFTKLRAGITGETEPLKRLGILVDEQTVAQYALKSGISKTGKALTQQQKLQARYGAIMEQTAKAQGDLARTMDSPVNQLRRLNAEFDLAKIALGQALQPALLAVLPALTGFARGLTNVLKGGGDGDPLSGTATSFANATALIKARVDTSILGVVEEIERLKEETNGAVGGYIEAAEKTRTLYVSIQMQPKTTGYLNVMTALAKIDTFVGGAATAKDIEKDVGIILNGLPKTGSVDQTQFDATVTALLGLVNDKEAAEEIRDDVEILLSAALADDGNVDDDELSEIIELLLLQIQSLPSAQNVSDEISMMMKAAMEDGKIEDSEIEEVLAAFREQIKQILERKEQERIEAHQAVSAQFEADPSMTEDQLNEAHKEIDADYTAAVEGIKLAAEVAEAEIKVGNWSAYTISAADRGLMEKAVSDEINASGALLVAANAQVEALFDGSPLEEAVLGMYGTLTEKVKSNNETLQEMLNGWYQGHEIDWAEVMRIRQENADALAIMEGGLTSQGKINKGLLAIGGGTPREITNFAKGYSELFGSMVEGYKQQGEERENLILSMPDKYIASQGMTRQGMLDQNKAHTDSLVQETGAMLMNAVAESVAPQIRKVLNDPAAGYAETLDMANAIDGLLYSIKRDSLDDTGKAQYDALQRMFDQLNTMMTLQLNNLPINQEEEYTGTPRGPGSYGPPVEIDLPDEIKLPDTPTNLPGGAGGGSFNASTNVNVDIGTSDVLLMLDGYRIAQTVIKYLPKVQAQTGKTVYSASPSNIKYITNEVM